VAWRHIDPTKKELPTRSKTVHDGMAVEMKIVRASSRRHSETADECAFDVHPASLCESVRDGSEKGGRDHRSLMGARGASRMGA
jgi:hypothetical protein